MASYRLVRDRAHTWDLEIAVQQGRRGSGLRVCGDVCLKDMRYTQCRRTRVQAGMCEILLSSCCGSLHSLGLHLSTGCCGPTVEGRQEACVSVICQSHSSDSLCSHKLHCHDKTYFFPLTPIESSDQGQGDFSPQGHTEIDTGRAKVCGVVTDLSAPVQQSAKPEVCLCACPLLSAEVCLCACPC